MKKKSSGIFNDGDSYAFCDDRVLRKCAKRQ